MIKKSISWSRLLGVLTLVGAFGASGCDLTVDAPDRVADADLDAPEAVTALVAGAARDYSYALAVPGGGGTITVGAMFTDELVHSGTWVGLRGPSDGLSQDDWVEAQSRWGEPSQARWVAENGIPRVSAILSDEGMDPNSSEEVATLNLLAGLANLELGDNFCQAVIDGGGYQDYTTFYTRAIPYLQDAVTIGTAAGDGSLSGNYDDGDDVAMAAHGAMARVYMQMGDWTNAVAQAALVNDDFVYNAVYDETAGVSNDLHWWAYLRNETTIWGTPFMALGDNVDDPLDGGDPRVPYDILLDASQSDGWAKSGDGRRPFFRMLKFDSYSDEIGMVKGTEARLIEAEDALVNGGTMQDVADGINAVRDVYGMAHVAVPADATAAWTLLMQERGIELYLEDKRLGDFRRWAKTTPGAASPVWSNFLVVRDEATGQPYTADVWQNPITDADYWISDGDLCSQVSKNEKDSNPNIS